MSISLPERAADFLDWPWEQIEPAYNELAERSIDAANVAAWLGDWSRLAELLYERYQRLWVATTVDTNDADAKKRYEAYLDEIYPHSQAAEQRLKEKLLHSGLQVDGFEIPLRNLRAESEIFRQENLPLLAQELKLSAEHEHIMGEQAIAWEGRELTIQAVKVLLQSPDRQQRERAWRMALERQLADRDQISALWRRLLETRTQLAANAGMRLPDRSPDYRSYRWKQMFRFDYTPTDCERFHRAIEDVVVPAAEQLYEKRRRQMGIDSIRPWDIDVDPFGRPPLQPFKDVEQLEGGIAAIFRQIDPQLNDYFETMRYERLLDLEDRKGKATGGYCTEFIASKRPFVFMNATGIHEDVQTLLHEGGHAFHVFECAYLPYFRQKEYPLEFAEVASTSMELLGAPYLSMPGGFYLPVDAARARIIFLTEAICFWPYMAVVDAFQHWVYQNPSRAADPAACDDCWAGLWGRFMRGQDWSGLDDAMVTGWQRKDHIPTSPFYYVEYGLAQLGAFQIWRNSLQDPRATVQAYRRALALGGTATLPDLFRAAGARLAFDAEALQDAVSLALKVIEEMENIRA